MDQNNEVVLEPVPGRRFRRNLVALGAAAGLTLAGLGVSGATAESASPGQEGQSSASRAEGRGEHAERRGAHRTEMLETAAAAIGISSEDLKAELKAGKSIATVANEHSVDPQKVVDALVAEAQSHLNERMTKLVNRTPGEGRPDGEAEASEPAAA